MFVSRRIGDILEIAVAIILMVLCRDTFGIGSTSIDAGLKVASILVGVVAAGTINIAFRSALAVVDGLCPS